MAEPRKRGGFLRGLQNVAGRIGDRLVWGQNYDPETGRFTATPAQVIGGVGSRALNFLIPGAGTAANIAGNAYYGTGPLGGLFNRPQQIPRETFSPGPYGVTVPNIGFPGPGGVPMPPVNTGVVPPNLAMPNVDPNLSAREALIAAQLSGNLNAARPTGLPYMPASSRFGSGLGGTWNVYGGQQVGQFDPTRVGGIAGHAYGDTGLGRMGGTATQLALLAGDPNSASGGGGGGFSQEDFLAWKAGKTQ